jgi:hypothetical protein
MCKVYSHSFVILFNTLQIFVINLTLLQIGIETRSVYITLKYEAQTFSEIFHPYRGFFSEIQMVSSLLHMRSKSMRGFHEDMFYT